MRSLWPVMQMTDVELQCDGSLADSRVDPLVATVNAENVVGFPNGRLFLDSMEQMLAVALLNRFTIYRASPHVRDGLSSGDGCESLRS